MKADKAIATYRRMRAQPLWRLLASNTGPTVIGLLQVHLRIPMIVTTDSGDCDHPSPEG